MTPDTEALATKERRSLRVARALFDRGDFDFAASRAYYAMFYLAEALLLAKGRSFSKHTAVISAFGQEFVKSGALSKEHHAALRTAFDERNVGDYDYAEPFAADRARDLLDRAEAFVAAAERHLQPGGYWSRSRSPLRGRAGARKTL